MEKVIKVGEHDVKFKANGATTRRYRAKFHRDIFTDIQRIQVNSNGESTVESLEAFENIAYIMAKQADDTVSDDVDEWLEQFDIFSIYEVLPQLIELWNSNMVQINEPKKK